MPGNIYIAFKFNWVTIVDCSRQGRPSPEAWGQIPPSNIPLPLPSNGGPGFYPGKLLKLYIGEFQYIY